MNSEMTLLAVAGKCGALGASGLASSPATPARWNRSSAASQPIPIPARCRNLRRDVSVDIDELVHIEEQQAEPRQRVALQVIERGVALLCGRRAAERQLEPGFDGSFGAIAGDLLKALCETLGLCDGEFAVHQRERLRSYGRAVPAGATRGRVRRVEDLKQGKSQRAFHLKVNAAPVVLRGIGIGRPEIRESRREDLFARERRDDADTTHF